jgi:hypothetical protein
MGVGVLIYLVKHSRPRISNSVREMSNLADGAIEGHFKALLRTSKYAIDTEAPGLLIQPKFYNDGFYLEGLSDSEYAGDPDTRISVSGYVLYLCGEPIAWKAKAGRVSPYHRLKLSIMQHSRLQKKLFLQRII